MFLENSEQNSVSNDEIEVKKVSSDDSTSDSNSGEKKKKKFKVPSALSILIGVLIGSIVLTWIIHIITVGDYKGGTDAIRIFTTDDTGALVMTGFWEGGNTWYITEGANAIVDGQWVNISQDISGFDIGDQITIGYGEMTPIIDGDWFNFGDSNWYISNDGMYGIGDVISATVGGIFSAADLIFFIIGIGIIIELLMETSVLKSLVNSMIKGLNNRRILLIPSLFVLFSLWGTIMGTQEATLALMPIVVPALIVAGFDAMTGFLVILVGVTTGIAASILEPFALGTLAGAFNEVWQNTPGTTGTIGIGTGIVLRIVLFILYTTVGALFVTWYGNRVLKKGKSVEDIEMQEGNKEWAKVAFDDTEHRPLDKKQKIALSVVGIMMIWMVVVLLPWSSWIPTIEEQQWWITFSHLFFFKSLIGGWSFFQLGFLFVFGWFICAKTFGYNGKKMANNWKNALSTFKTVSFILILSRATSIVLTNSGSATYLANTIFTNATDGLGALGLSLVVFPIYVLMALAIPSMSGLAGISAPIIAPIVGGYGQAGDLDSMKAAIIGIMALYPLAQGLVNMASPTTGLVVAQAEASNTSYAKSVPLLLSYAGVIAVIGISVVSLSFLI